MESIAEIEPEGNEKNEKIVLKHGELGCVAVGQHDKWHGVMPPKRSRGDISSFSAGSRRRLRQSMALARHIDGDSVKVGITLTIPGEILPVEQVRKLWKNWVNYWTRHYPRFPLLWRIELQKRKQAHWHCVAWVPKTFETNGFVGKKAVALIEMQLKFDWLDILKTVVDWDKLNIKTIDGASKHAVEIRYLDDSTPSGIIGYLADHTSKHKQEQLGWIGRQWGFLNRRMLSFEGFATAEISPEDHKKAARFLRRFKEKVDREFKPIEKAFNERVRNAPPQFRAEMSKHRPQKPYTGVRLSPTGNVNGALFGRDRERYLRALGLEQPELDFEDGKTQKSTP